MYDSPIEYDRSKFIWPVNGNGKYRNLGLGTAEGTTASTFPRRGTDSCGKWRKVVCRCRAGNTVILRHEDKFFRFTRTIPKIWLKRRA